MAKDKEGVASFGVARSIILLLIILLIAALILDLPMDQILEHAESFRNERHPGFGHDSNDKIRDRSNFGLPLGIPVANCVLSIELDLRGFQALFFAVGLGGALGAIAGYCMVYCSIRSRQEMTVGTYFGFQSFHLCAFLVLGAL